MRLNRLSFVSCCAVALLLLAGGTGLAGAQGSAEKAVATVNGEKITESELFKRLLRMQARDFIVNAQPLQVKNGTAGQIMLDTLINDRLILQLAAKSNLVPTQTDLATELEQVKKQPGYIQALASKLTTEENVKNEITVQLARFRLAVAGTAVSPAELEAYYRNHIASYTIPERWKLSA